MNEVVVEGQRFEYEIMGDGFPVVAVNNVQVPMGMWPHRDEVAALNELGLSLVSYRHLGTTDTIEGVAADVGRLLDHLGLRDVALWGYSQGAMTAQELALARPDIVRAGVFMATRGRLTAMDRFRYALDDEMGESEMSTLLLVLMNYGLELVCDNTRFEALLEFQRPPEHAPTDEAIALRARALRLGSTYGDPSRLDALAGVMMPCMVVAFSHDGNIPPVLNREVAAAIPGCDYVEIAGPGHAGGMTHRREVREHVLPFLVAASTTVT